jgi:predicted DNA binding protein
MQLSTIIGAMALVLAGVLVTGYAAGDESTQTPAIKETAQKKVEQREAQRRAAVAEHKKRKEDFARRCTKPGLTDAELEACRAAYRRL